MGVKPEGDVNAPLQPVTLDPRLSRQTALIMALAAPAAVLCVASGYVIFEHESLANGWWMIRRLKWWGLGAALGGAVVGYYSGAFHQRSVAFHLNVREGKLSPSDPGPAVILLSIPRVFVHFPFHGFLTLFAFLWAVVALPLGWLLQKLRMVSVAEKPPSLEERIPGFTPLWFLLGPLMSLPNEAEHAPTPPSLEALARSMPRWLAWFPPALAFATQFVEEESGAPVDPRALVVLGAYWFGDYVAMWWVMRARVLRA